MPKPKFESYTSKALSEKQIRNMFLVCDNIEDDLLLAIAIEFGLRREDIPGIKIDDVKLDDGKLYFYEQKKDHYRSLPIKPEIIAKFRQFINTITDNRKTLFSFTSGRTAYTRINELYSKAGYSRKILYKKSGHVNVRFEPSFPFHALRGTCYKRLRAEGRTMEFAAAWLNDTIHVAAKHYGKVSDAELEDAIRKESEATL